MEAAQAPTPTSPPHGRKPRRHKKVKPDLTHWPKMWEMTVRAAVNEEGEAIHALVDAMTMQYGWKVPQCRWDRVAPFWYGAEVQGVLLGAVQICIGWPIGRIELLSVRPGLSHTKTAKIVKALLYHAFGAMKLDGTELACALVSDKENHFMRVLERWGAKGSVKGRMFFYSLDHPAKE